MSIGEKNMFADQFEEHLEMAIIKIQSKINVTYEDAVLLGSCIAHAYFEIEGDAVILANNFDLEEYEIAALTKDKTFFDKKYNEFCEDKFLAYYGE